MGYQSWRRRPLCPAFSSGWQGDRFCGAQSVHRSEDQGPYARRLLFDAQTDRSLHGRIDFNDCCQLAGRWIASYAAALAALVSHKTTRVRWEVAHALALVATLAPAQIESLLPQLAETLRTDASVIVRDYTTDAIANYAATGKAAAEKAYPSLKEALLVWNGKQAGHALKGLANVARKVPAVHDELRSIAEEYASSGRAVVRKAAKELLKTIEVSAERVS
ncbi:MAG TPA: hypothetical protein PLH19_03730 [Anaerolineae bacterium]|nr:hypothetical protein [Anaerolineae bacterium]HQH37632.1 hypothetical protein [Anaerolineae bacterium]